jgi:RHS repeat-associated protein
VWRAAPAAYGAMQPDEDPDGDSNLVTFNLRFPGQYYDAETGLHYNRYRYYDPTIGRYISADPIGQFGALLPSRAALVAPPLVPTDRDPFLSASAFGLAQVATGPFEPSGNVYGYASADPLVFGDPLGLWTISFGITGSAAGFGAGGGGGTFLNFGFDPTKGFSVDAFSLSITGLATGGGNAGLGAGVGFTVSFSSNCNVSGLLGNSLLAGRGGIGPTAIGASISRNGTVKGGFVTFHVRSKGPGGSAIPGASAQFATTSAIVQYSNGTVSVGATNKGALWSSN